MCSPGGLNPSPRHRFDAIVSMCASVPAADIDTSRLQSQLLPLPDWSNKDALSMLGALLPKYAAPKERSMIASSDMKDRIHAVFSSCAPVGAHLGCPLTLWRKLSSLKTTCYHINRRTDAITERPQCHKPFVVKSRRRGPCRKAPVKSIPDVLSADAALATSLLPVGTNGFSGQWVKRVFQKHLQKPRVAGGLAMLPFTMLKEVLRYLPIFAVQTLAATRTSPSIATLDLRNLITIVRHPVYKARPAWWFNCALPFEISLGDAIDLYELLRAAAVAPLFRTWRRLLCVLDGSATERWRRKPI